MPSQSSRGAARCVECGRAYAVRRTADGTVLPIGSPDCACGGTSFAELG